MYEKIMIVDDEKEIADLLELYLRNDGFNDLLKYYVTMNKYLVAVPPLLYLVQ